MYNEEQKKQFIEKYAGSLNTAAVAMRLFNEIEKYEIAWGADFCTKTAKELQPVIDEVAGLRTKSHWMTLTILREYVKWCRAMKVPDACDGMLHIKMVGIDKVKKQMVGSPMHLQTVLDIIFDKESEETIECLYRCYLWMAYVGMDEADTVLLNNADVDLTKMAIFYKGERFPIYREAVPAFNNAVSLSCFRYIHPHYEEKEVYMDRIPSDLVMRGIKSIANIYTMREVISRKNAAAVKNGDTNMQISYQRVKMSGLFYQTYERERLGLPFSFSKEAAHMMEGKIYALSGRETLEHKKNRLVNSFTEDYQRWKLAFTI